MCKAPPTTQRSPDWLIAPTCSAPDKQQQPKSTDKSRNVVLTLWHDPEKPAPNPESFLLDGWITYGIRSALERAPDTGRLHYHYYLELSEQQRFSYVHSKFKGFDIWLQPRKKSAYVARMYCTPTYFSKKRRCTKMEYTCVDEHPEFIECGQMKQAGRRTDWESLYTYITNSEVLPKFDAVAELYPRFAVTHMQHIKRFLAHQRHRRYREEDAVKPVVTVITGDPGTGKDTTVFDFHDASEVYELGPDESGSIWWDGYSGERVILISDFKWWMTRSRLLNICGGRMCRVNPKGYYDYVKPTHIYITSNYEPDQWYPDACGVSWKGLGKVDPAFASRMDNHWRFELSDDQLEEIKPPTVQVFKRPNFRQRKARGLAIPKTYDRPKKPTNVDGSSITRRLPRQPFRKIWVSKSKNQCPVSDSTPRPEGAAADAVKAAVSGASRRSA